MASSRFEVEVTVTSARDLKNVNWRNGDLRPYAVLWIDDGPKVTTNVAVGDGDTSSPVFDAKLAVPLPPSARRIEDSVLRLDIVHARSDSDDEAVKPLVGSAKIPLRDVIDEVGVGGGKMERTLKLKRPSGRPQGKVEVKIAVREPHRYYDPYAASAPYGQSARDFAAPYSQPPTYGSYGGQPPYAGGYGGQPPYGYGGQPPYGPGATVPPAGYPYGSAPPLPVGGAAGYGGSSYGGGYGEEKKKKSGMGVGTGVAVGAVGGLLGGLALAEGLDYVEDKIEDRVEDRVEDDLAYQDGGYDDF